MGTFPVLLLILLLVVLEHPSTFLAAVICTSSSCFTNLVFSSHTPTCSSFGTITFIRIHRLILVSRCESVRIASILPKCALPFPIAFAMCASQDHSFDISTSRYVYWSAIGNSRSPYFLVKVTGFTLSSLHTTTAHFLYVRCHSPFPCVL